MMARDFLPSVVNRQLFGDRAKFGTAAPEGDADWQRWLAAYPTIYATTQRSTGLFSAINDAGYSVLTSTDLTGRTVAELGPGACHHFRFMKTKPKLYVALDISKNFLGAAHAKCAALGIAVHGIQTSFQDVALPLESGSIDVFLSFYSLEHIQHLSAVLNEIRRVLKPGGKLIGAIPTEGGLAWGAGRWLTSRRVLRDRFGFDVVKMICWEHPNFADAILKGLRERFLVSSQTWPLPFLPLDLNLLVKFVAKKPIGN